MVRRLFPRLISSRIFPRATTREILPRINYPIVIEYRSNKIKIPINDVIKMKQAPENTSAYSRSWARSICLPPARQDVSVDQMTQEEKRCFNRAATSIQRKIERSMGIT